MTDAHVITIELLARIPGDLLVFALVAAHIAGLGVWASDRLKFQGASQWAQWAVNGALGFSLFGLQIFIFGYLHLWNRPAFLGTGLLSVALLLTLRRPSRASLPHLLEPFAEIYRANRLLTILCAALFLVLAVAAMKPPLAGDELEGHWAAPVLWAQAGHWVYSPFRQTNGPSFGQMFYLVPALFHRSTAAHWTHLLSFALLLSACAGLAKRVGGSAIAAITAALACPVIAMQSCIGYNDVSSAMLCVGAYVALFCARPDEDSRLLPRAALLAGGLLFAASFSAKPFTVVALIAAAQYVFIRAYDRNAPHPLMPALRSVFLLTFPFWLAGFVWAAHTHALIGKFSDSHQAYILKSPDDPRYRSGTEVGRIPTPKELLTVPFIPFFTPIIGQGEPYGGRTGLLLVPFGLLGWFSLRYLPEEQRRLAKRMTASAFAFLLLLGLIAVKTRYHSFVWAMLTPLISVAYAQWARDRKYSQTILFIFYLLAFISMADWLRVVTRDLLPQRHSVAALSSSSAQRPAQIGGAA